MSMCKMCLDVDSTASFHKTLGESETLTCYYVCSCKPVSLVFQRTDECMQLCH